MAVIVRHPTEQTDIVVSNNGFFPDLSLDQFKADYNIDDRSDPEIVQRIIQANMITVNDDLQVYSCTQVRKGHTDLLSVPAEHYGDTSKLIIYYKQAVFARCKADILRNHATYDLTKRGSSELEQRESNALWYVSESISALRKILGRPTIRVRRVKPKNNTKNNNRDDYGTQ